MKTKDRIKEEIGLYKLLMTILSAIDSSIVGWLFGNIEESSIITLVVGFIVMVALTAAILIFFIKINTKIEDLYYV